MPTLATLCVTGKLELSGFFREYTEADRGVQRGLRQCFTKRCYARFPVQGNVRHQLGNHPSYLRKRSLHSETRPEYRST